MRLIGIAVSPDVLRAFATCFEERDIPVTLKPCAGERRGKTEVSACVVGLKSVAMEGLKTVQEIAHRSEILYGVGAEHHLFNARDMRLNVLLEESNEASIRAAVEKTARFVYRRATLHDRVPIVTAVSLHTGTVRLNGLSVNVGCGGMALRLRRAADLPARVHLAWSVDGSNRISLRATPRWTSGRMVGLQYLEAPPEILIRWIRNYATHF